MLQSWFGRVAVAGVLAFVAFSPATAHAAPCDISGQLDVRVGQPIDANVLKVARVAGAEAGVPDKWEIEYDAWLCNSTTKAYTVVAAKIEHLNASNGVIRTTTPLLRGDLSIGVGNNPNPTLLRDQQQFAFPLPAKARITMTLSPSGGGTAVNVVETHPVAEHRNPGPVRGYFPPFRQNELPADHFWYQGRHGDSNFQRYAYDLDVRRWTGSGWTHLKAGAPPDSKAMTDFLSFGRKLYAVSDGEIIGCNRGADDHDAGAAQGNVPGGNLLWIRTGDETILYAHLRKNTIPFSLCPFSDDAEHRLADPNANPPSDAPYRIKAGDFLGESGSSGSSLSGPHLHIHVFRGLPRIWGGSETGIDADSRPMRFVNTRVQPAAATNVVASKWRDLDSSATLPYDTRIQGDPCAHARPGGTEVTRLEVRASCFGELFNVMIYRGYRPTHIDVAEGPSQTSWSSTWRSSDGTAWLLFNGISAAQVHSNINDLAASGYRALNVESYFEGGALRFSLLMVRQPGGQQTVTVGQDAATFQTSFNNLTATGYRPVTSSVTAVAGSPRYTTIYERAQVGSFVFKPAIALADYGAEFDAQEAAGRQLAHITAYPAGGGSFVSGIWYSALTGSYVASGALSTASMRTEIANNLAAGRHTRSVSGWYSGGVFRYVALWRAAPSTTITSAPPSSTTSTTAGFGFKSSDPLALFECKLDAGAFSPCTSPKVYTGLSPGSHTFTLRSRNRQGVPDPTPETRSWTITS